MPPKRARRLARTRTGHKTQSLQLMFTDWVDSTAFKERVGEDASLSTLLDYYRLLSEEARPHGGTLWKFLGDGMLASFASSKEAVLAAIAIQRSVAEYNLRHRTRDRMPKVRIGIDGGQVNVVDLGGGRHDVVGRIVDRCSRICAMAEGDHIMVTDEGNYLTGWLRSEIDTGNLKVVPHRSTQWKGGGQQRVRVKEIVYRVSPGRGFLEKQDELRSGQRIIRRQGVAYKMAAKLIGDAQERLLVAVRTLPVVTGRDKHPGDDVFERALAQKVELLRTNPRRQPKVILMFSISHTRRDIQESPNPKARLHEVQRRLERLYRVAESSRGKLKIGTVDELANPLVVADDSYGIWVLFKSHAPIEKGEPGLGLFSVGQAESQRVWDYIRSQSDRRRQSTGTLMRLLTKGLDQ